MAPPRPPNLLRRPLDKLTAWGLAGYLGWARVGRCEVVPPGPGSPGWVVLVFAPDGGDPAPVTSLDTAKAWMARAMRNQGLSEAGRQRIAQSNTVRAAERQVRRELARLSAKQEAEEEVQR